jgi:hypothetical protein
MHRPTKIISSLSPIKIVGQLMSGKVFHKFAGEYDLVYFGHVSAQDDEHKLVRGITTSAKHRDSHYCVGTIHGHDVILLEREDELKLATDPKPHKYEWIILQIDLHGSHDLSHVFIDGKHHNDTFYRTLFAKFSRLLKVDHGLLSHYDPLFSERFIVYTPPDNTDRFPSLLTPDAAATLAHHFGHFDFEWSQDQVLVYSTGRKASKHLLEHMLKAGIYLARELEKTALVPVAEGAVSEEDNEAY